MNSFDFLDTPIVDELLHIIRKKWQDDHLDAEFSNEILKSDVLDILDRYCTVIYYPLDKQECNNGFHITGIPDQHGNEQQFVFINTSQTMEKQVFTAAHELGHIWNVDSLIAQKLKLTLNPALTEQIINRFAAELLMPKNIFLKICHLEYRKYHDEKNNITLGNMLRLIAALMNTFLVPMKAVFLRLIEVGLLDSESCRIFIPDSTDNNNNLAQVIADRIQQIIEENGYTELRQGSGKKWIKGLSTLLDLAEADTSISRRKIEHLRDIFELPRRHENKQLSQKVRVHFE